MMRFSLRRSSVRRYWLRKLKEEKEGKDEREEEGKENERFEETKTETVQRQRNANGGAADGEQEY
jgi:hypothetical protein